MKSKVNRGSVDLSGNTHESWTKSRNCLLVSGKAYSNYDNGKDPGI